MAKLSVLMPACNVEKYIEECMDSVVGQTLQDIEIIVVDDGSKDATGVILDAYAEKDPRVRVIHKVNTGYGHSMNVALEHASGEYIGIIETDDYADSCMFETLYVTAKENDADVVKSNYYNYYSNNPEKTKKVMNLDKVGIYDTLITPKDEKNLFLLTQSIWSGIYRRKMIEDNNIRFTETPGASYQDTAFAFKVWASAEKVVLLNEAYLHYRRDNDSSSVNNPGKVFCVCDEYAEIESFLNSNPSKKEEFEEIKNICMVKTYKWNLNRLGLEYKYAFLLMMSEKYKKLIESGKLREDMLDEKKWADAYEIATDPQNYFKKICKKELKGRDTVAEILEENKHLRKKLKKVRNSNSFKIGRMLTLGPRAVRKLFTSK